jgi:hypothetical protein
MTRGSRRDDSPWTKRDQQTKWWQPWVDSFERRNGITHRAAKVTREEALASADASEDYVRHLMSKVEELLKNFRRVDASAARLIAFSSIRRASCRQPHRVSTENRARFAQKRAVQLGAICGIPNSGTRSNDTGLLIIMTIESTHRASHPWQITLLWVTVSTRWQRRVRLAIGNVADSQDPSMRAVRRTIATPAARVQTRI